MLHVQHLVIQNVLTANCGTPGRSLRRSAGCDWVRDRSSQLAPQLRLLRNVRALQFAVKVFWVQALEKLLKIKMPPHGRRPGRMRAGACIDRSRVRILSPYSIWAVKDAGALRRYTVTATGCGTRAPEGRTRTSREPHPHVFFAARMSGQAL